jgi:hypothetical protein
MIGRLINLVKDMVKANIDDFRRDGMRYFDLLTLLNNQIAVED